MAATQDARFADGDEQPVAIRAEDQDDLTILSALVQDAVLPVAEMSYDPKARRLALLVNRFRWEDAKQAEREGRPYERVRALLVLGDVLKLQSDGIDRQDKGTILELLALRWEAGEDGTGTMLLEFAGYGTMRAEMECINADLRDVTKPYLAPSRKLPAHPE